MSLPLASSGSRPTGPPRDGILASPYVSAMASPLTSPYLSAMASSQASAYVSAMASPMASSYASAMASPMPNPMAFYIGSPVPSPMPSPMAQPEAFYIGSPVATPVASPMASSMPSKQATVAEDDQLPKKERENPQTTDEENAGSDEKTKERSKTASSGRRESKEAAGQILQNPGRAELPVVLQNPVGTPGALDTVVKLKCEAVPIGLNSDGAIPDFVAETARDEHRDKSVSAGTSSNTDSVMNPEESATSFFKTTRCRVPMCTAQNLQMIPLLVGMPRIVQVSGLLHSSAKNRAECVLPRVSIKGLPGLRVPQWERLSAAVV